ncbi:unnamed protein product [Arctogadus glacialis]
MLRPCPLKEGQREGSQRGVPGYSPDPPQGTQGTALTLLNVGTQGTALTLFRSRWALTEAPEEEEEEGTRLFHAEASATPTACCPLRAHYGPWAGVDVERQI